MEPPKPMKRPIVLLGGVLLLGALARVQLEGFDYAAASGATQPYDDLWGRWWRIVMLVLAGAAATAVAAVASHRLSRLTAVGLATAVGGIVLARFEPFSGILIGFVAGMLVASIRARSLALAALAIVYGAVAGALALATVHDLSDGPGLAACTLIALSLAVAATLLFSVRVSRWPVLSVLHRRGRTTRAAWLVFVPVGLWFGLSADTVRRVWRLDPNLQLMRRPLGAAWMWPGPLSVYSLSGRPGAADLTDLRTWPELEQLLLDGAEIDDDDLVSLEGLSRLWNLRLRDTQVSDGGLVHLRGLTRVQWLDLSGTEIRGDGLRDLAGLRALGGITLDRTSVSDDALSHLEGLALLSAVSLRDTLVAGPGLRSLSKLPALSFLALDGCQITDDSLEGLAGLATLKHLGLGNTPITDLGLQHLSGMTGLVQLDLHTTRVSDAGLETLAGLPGPVRLDVRQTAVTREGVERLKKALPGCSVEWDESLTYLRQLD